MSDPGERYIPERDQDDFISEEEWDDEDRVEFWNEDDFYENEPLVEELDFDPEFEREYEPDVFDVPDGE